LGRAATIARSLRNHRELILNYFRAQKLLSSGVVEGLNNKAKVTMRKSYGFRTYHVFELAFYHSLGKLPGVHPRFPLTSRKMDARAECTDEQCRDDDPQGDPKKTERHGTCNQRRRAGMGGDDAGEK
jgi:hypothetical protein